MNSAMNGGSLRVLLATGSLHGNSGGPFWTVKETADGLRRAGHEPVVLGTKDHWRQGPPEKWRPHRAHSFGKIGPYSLHWSPRLGSWMQNCLPRVDVVSLQNLWIRNHRAVARWCRRNDVPYMLTPHGGFNDYALGISRWKKRIARRWFADEVVSGAQCFHALTESEYEALRRFRLKQPVCVIPNGVALPTLREGPRNAPAPSLDESRICLYLGRLHPIKGLENLLAAWAELAEVKNGWKLVIAGPDPQRYRATLEAAVAERGLGNDVVIVGPRYDEEKSRLFFASDFFVLPSFSEGMPMAALEAMAHRLPVLITRPCGLAQIEQSEPAGRIVAPAVEDLRGGLSSLMSMPDRRRVEMGVRARRIVEEQFAWSSVIAQLEEVFEWMLGARAAPATVRMD